MVLLLAPCFKFLLFIPQCFIIHSSNDTKFLITKNFLTLQHKPSCFNYYNQYLPIFLLMGKVLFPSRPKPQANDHKNNRNLDKERQKQQKMFHNTIKDMKQMVDKHFGSYNKDTLGMLKKNTKMPYTHLMGRRNKIIEKYSVQKARARQENIQYDSSLQLLNSNIVEKSKQQKDQFLKNKYKYQGQHLTEGRLGRQTDGMLTLSKRDINRINGKTFQPREKNQGKPQRRFKHKKVRKGSKGNKGKKGGRRH